MARRDVPTRGGEQSVRAPVPKPAREPGMPEPGDPTGVDAESSEVRGYEAEKREEALQREVERSRR